MGPRIFVYSFNSELYIYIYIHTHIYIHTYMYVCIYNLYKDSYEHLNVFILIDALIQINAINCHQSYYWSHRMIIAEISIKRCMRDGES